MGPPVAADGLPLFLPQSIGGFDRVPEPGPAAAGHPHPGWRRARCRTSLPFFSDLDHAWQTYLRIGGFPRAVRDFAVHADVSEGFAQALWDVIAGDAFQRPGMSDGEAMSFLERLVTGLSSPLNASAVARDVGLSDHHRVDDRIDSLGFALMAWRCHQSRSGLPNLRAQEKVYLVDPLIARLPHLRDGRRRDPDDSPLSEQQLGILLLRAAGGQWGPGKLLDASTVMYEKTGQRGRDRLRRPGSGDRLRGKVRRRAVAASRGNRSRGGGRGDLRHSHGFRPQGRGA